MATIGTTWQIFSQHLSNIISMPGAWWVRSFSSAGCVKSQVRHKGDFGPTSLLLSIRQSYLGLKTQSVGEATHRVTL